MDAANKAVEELQEELQQAKQAAAEEASKAAEVHAVEIQKLAVERTKSEVGGFSYSCRLGGVALHPLQLPGCMCWLTASPSASSKRPGSHPVCCWLT